MEALSSAAGLAEPLSSPTVSHLLAVVAAVAPGLYAWYSGRRLVAAIDDPAFTDLHYARSRRLGLLSVVCGPLALLLGGRFWWALPLLVVALAAGTWPARRRIFDERCSFGRYLSFWSRFLVAMFGWWLPIAASPVLITLAWKESSALALATAAALVTTTLLVLTHFPRFWLSVLRARPLSAPELDARFEAILARSTCVRPSVYRVGEAGCHFMNAFALPSARQPAVAFGDTLLERLSPDEVAAIFAHEVAHLEHHTPELMRKRSLTVVLLTVAIAAVSIVLAHLPATQSLLLFVVPWIGVALALGLAVGRSQAAETASDVRAAELTGDPELVIRALTALHAHLHLPRHWPHEVEPSQTHPSLARRIQAIRARAAAPGEALPDVTIARSATNGTRIALDDTRAYWFEGVPHDTPADIAALREHASSYRALAYSELSELRLVATGGGRALRARDLAGHSWAVTVHPDDVLALRRALEVVDTRLGFRLRQPSRLAVRAVACGLLVALLAAGQAGVVLLPLAIALVRPGLAAVAAVGAMAIGTAAALVLTGEIEAGAPGALAAAAGILVLGSAAVWLAWRWWRAMRIRAARPVDTTAELPRLALDSRPTARATLLALGASALVLGAALAAEPGGTTPATVLADPAVLSLAIVALGSAAALATVDARRWRGASIATGIAGAAMLVLASRGAMSVRGAPLTVTSATAERVGEITLPNEAWALELSPDGSHWAAVSALPSQGTYADDDGVVFRWTIGRSQPGGAVGEPSSMAAIVREVDAIDLALIEGERFVALAATGESLLVRVEPIAGTTGAGASGGSWRRSLPPLFAPELLVDVEAGRWTVTGRRDDGALVAASGSVDGGEIVQRFWPGDSLWVEPLSVSADGAALGYRMRPPTGLLPSLLAGLRGGHVRAELWRFAAGAPARLGLVRGIPGCRSTGAGAICVGLYADRSTLWQVTPDGRIAPIGSLPAGYGVRHIARAGGVAALAHDGTGPLLIDPASRRATRVELRGVSDSTRTRHATGAHAIGDVLAIVETGHQTTTIGVYRLDGPR